MKEERVKDVRLKFLEHTKGPGKNRSVPFPFHLKIYDFYIGRELFSDRTFSHTVGLCLDQA